jgi:hypothetical protein
MKSDDRQSYFSYTDEDWIKAAPTQCDLCIFLNGDLLSRCDKFDEFRPDNVLLGEVRCRYFEAI